jgi:protein-S-isoprenylcysteine O-methyltransferase Ste14
VGIFSVAAWLVLFGLLPWAIARRGRNIGWRNGHPGLVNRLGLVLVGLGAAGLAWCLASHYEPGETVAVSLVPEKLLASGPYRFSRNPMYVCEVTIMLGWASFFGSPVLVPMSTALATFMRYAVGREERTLEARFGDPWREYARKVPRWL